MIDTSAFRLFRIGGLILLPALLGAAALGQEVATFEARSPVGIVVGAVWFADQGLSSIRRIDRGGAVREFPTGAPPQSLVTGPDGNLWYTLFSPARVGRMTPSGAIREFEVPTANAMSFSMAAVSDGSLWFTQSNLQRVGRITTSGDISEFPAPSGSWLGRITAGPDGNLWFTRPEASRICRITPSGAVTEFAVPTAGSMPIDVATGPDGNLWFVASVNTWDRRVGRITLSGEITDFPVPGYADRIVTGGDGNLWLAGVGTLQRLTTAGALAQYDASAIASNVTGLVIGPDGAIWVAVATDGWGDAGSIVRFRIDLSPCALDAATLCLSGGRFRVTTDWSGNGSSGTGRAVNLSANSGYFWFFDPSNLELVVKMLNGCSVNDHHWAFAAGLTSLDVTTTVTDTFTGATRTYTNSPGEPFPAILDTTAFAACP